MGSRCHCLQLNFTIPSCFPRLSWSCCSTAPFPIALGSAGWLWWGSFIFCLNYRAVQVGSLLAWHTIKFPHAGSPVAGRENFLRGCAKKPLSYDIKQIWRQIHVGGIKMNVIQKCRWEVFTKGGCWTKVMSFLLCNYLHVTSSNRFGTSLAIQYRIRCRLLKYVLIFSYFALHANWQDKTHTYGTWHMAHAP